MNVYEAAVRRVAFIFSRFERIVISISGGKDSTCLYHLALREAERCGRRMEAFFLDQEAEYQSTVDLMEEMMRHPLVIPRWYQVPIDMTNATSHRDLFLRAWGDGEEWVRPKSEVSIHSVDGPYPQRFYDFFAWFEAQDEVPTAHLVGLRQFESLNRHRATRKANGYEHYAWSTACRSPGSYRFYPIYDWHFRDVWKFIADSGVRYNRLYDLMFARSGQNISSMRVSNLIHEHAFRCLTSLQEFEPETYDRLVRRLGGVHAAALYGAERSLYSADVLPSRFGSWREYRDHMLQTTPTEKLQRFARRFAKQGDDELTCRWQVKQLLINDWEGRLPRLYAKRDRLREVWWKLL
jgi:predicted phosphoadenosine phosphosulfate sulfurtransferase